MSGVPHLRLHASRIQRRLRSAHDRFARARVLGAIVLPLLTLAPERARAAAPFLSSYYGVTIAGHPGAAAVGDLDGDGRPDLAVPNFSSTRVGLCRGHGDGTFDGNVDFEAGSQPIATAIADFNRDGKQDVAVLNYGSGTLSILLGNGDGTIGSRSDILTGGASPAAWTMADFNGDGFPDFAVGNVGADQVGILLGNGDGTLHYIFSIFNEVGPYSLAAGDLDGDGHPDLVVVNSGADQISVLTGNGFGGFSRAANYPTPSQPRSVAIADVNGDGHPDVVVAAADPPLHRVTVFLNNGSGTLDRGIVLELSAEPFAVAVTDIDGDGIPDLAVGTAGTTGLTILIGIGNGAFREPIVELPGISTHYVTPGSLNGDRYMDLVVTSDALGAALTVLSHQLQPVVSQPLPAPSNPVAVVGADLDGDGVPDLAAANLGTNSISIWLGQGPGRFGPRSDRAVGVSPSALAIADLNRDGRPDVIVANRGGNTVSVLLGAAPGAFASEVEYDAGPSPVSLAVGDLNGDGALDLVVANSTRPGTVSVLLGSGDGRLGTPAAIPVGPFPNSVVIGRFDLDAIPDLAVANQDSNTVSVLSGRGDGTFVGRTDYPTAPGPSSLVTADLSGEGRADLAVACGGVVSVLLGDPDGTFGARSDYSAPTDSHSGSLVSGDFNGDGVQDLAVVGHLATVSVFFGYGDGTFPLRIEFGAGLTPVAVAAVDLSGDGAPDLVIGDIGTNSVLPLLRSASPLAVHPRARSASLALAPSYPNPARLGSSIRFALPAAGRARLVLVDAAGRQVRELLNDFLAAGEHVIRWDGRTSAGETVPPGVYFCLLRSGSEQRSGRLIVAR